MRLIDADKLIKELEDWYKQCGGTTNQRDWIIQDVISSAMDTVNEAETIDAAPVRHGEWIPIKMEMSFGTLNGVKCSLCGEKKVREGSNYCPTCGAKMDGGKQDAEED